MNSWRWGVPSGLAVLAATVVSLGGYNTLVAWILSVGAVILGAVMLAAGWQKSRADRMALLSRTLLPASVVAFLVLSHLPLRVAFVLYQGEFEARAQQMALKAKGENLRDDVPFWIGPFCIKSAGRRGPEQIAFFSLGSDPAEVRGFVENPAGRGFNLMDCLRLDDRWAFVIED